MALLQSSSLQTSTLMNNNSAALANLVNHQHANTTKLMDLAFTELATKMDIAESFAAQGLSHSATSRDAMGLRTSIHVPQADK